MPIQTSNVVCTCRDCDPSYSVSLLNGENGKPYSRQVVDSTDKQYLAFFFFKLFKRVFELSWEGGGGFWVKSILQGRLFSKRCYHAGKNFPR